MLDDIIFHALVASLSRACKHKFKARFSIGLLGKQYLLQPFQVLGKPKLKEEISSSQELEITPRLNYTIVTTVATE